MILECSRNNLEVAAKFTGINPVVLVTTPLVPVLETFPTKRTVPPGANVTVLIARKLVLVNPCKLIVETLRVLRAVKGRGLLRDFLTLRRTLCL